MKMDKYKIFALLILGVFYGIYFTKMYIQKKHGIKTNQIGQRKEKSLHRTEMFMSAATCSAAAVQLALVLLDLNYAADWLRTCGFVIGIAGDGFFLAAVVCMKDSWRAGIPKADKTEIVTGGIYSVSRNPAFVGFDLMYLGVLFIYFNIFTGICTVFAIVMLHLQILQEEKYLERTFGSEYENYRKKVHRYIGKI